MADAQDSVDGEDRYEPWWLLVCYVGVAYNLIAYNDLSGWRGVFNVIGAAGMTSRAVWVAVQLLRNRYQRTG